MQQLYEAKIKAPQEVLLNIHLLDLPADLR